MSQQEEASGMCDCRPKPPTRVKYTGEFATSLWECVVCGSTVDGPPIQGMWPRPGEPGWARPFLRTVAGELSNAADEWYRAGAPDDRGTALRLDQPGDPRQEGALPLVSHELEALRTILVDASASDVALLLGIRSLAESTVGTALWLQIRSLPAWRRSTRLIVVDDTVEYREPTVGSFPDVLFAVAEALGSGVATNAAYDLIKQAVTALIRRTRSPAHPDHQPPGPDAQLTRADALTLALGRIARDWPEQASRMGQLAIRSEQHTPGGQWRFLLTDNRHTYTVHVPPGAPTLDRLSVYHRVSGRG